MQYPPKEPENNLVDSMVATRKAIEQVRKNLISIMLDFQILQLDLEWLRGKLPNEKQG